MLRRKIDEYLLQWKEKRKQALLITGARQVGKTFSIEKFALKNFENQVFLNFSIRTDLIDTFADLDNSNQKILITNGAIDYSSSIVKHIKLEDFLMMKEL